MTEVPEALRAASVYVKTGDGGLLLAGVTDNWTEYSLAHSPASKIVIPIALEGPYCKACHVHHTEFRYREYLIGCHFGHGDEVIYHIVANSLAEANDLPDFRPFI